MIEPLAEAEDAGPTARWRAEFSQEYPFASHVLDLDGVRYHYVDEGQGEPLLLVHGNPTWSFAWRRLIRDLSKEYRVLAVDHVGCGFSEKPQEYPYRLAQHVANLQQLVETLDLRNVTLLAHDWGGAIGLGAAGRMPERFSRFVLFNTAAFRSTRIPWRIAVCRWPIVGPFAVRGLNAFAKAALWMAVTKRPLMTPLIKRGYLTPYDSWANRVAVLRFVEDIPLKPSHPSYETLVEIENGLAQFDRSPMLLVWGLKDWCFTPEFLKEFQRRFPQAETVAYDNAGHYVFEDAAEEIPSAIRAFLSRHPLESTESMPVAID